MNVRKIGLIVVDDHRRVHQVITELIDFMDEVELLAHASNGQEALDLCERYQPDLILMDVLMPVMDGVEATRRIHEQYPAIKILALSSFNDQDTVRTMLANGAVGYVLKDSTVDHLEHAIRAAYYGNTVLSPTVMEEVLRQPQSDQSHIRLSRRETEILQLLAGGLTNDEIAAQLFISVSTVRFHTTNILEKLGAKTRAEALVTAAKNKLV